MSEEIPQYTRTNPSPRYIELAGLYRQLHEHGQPERNVAAAQTFDGGSLLAQAMNVKRFVSEYNVKTLMDYGSGKGRQYEPRPMTLADGSSYSGIPDFWGVDAVHCYDPGYEPFSQRPTERFEGVISTDVLEHVPEMDLPWLVDDIFSFASTFVFANIANYPARKVLPDGSNAHCTVQPAAWWYEIIKKVGEQHPNIRYHFVVETRRVGADGQVERLHEWITG